ncbi:quinoprotein glucose dehydrogenase [Halococcus morrhuae DSM 1307]|uniref:Quinoprotein glucose dehydrogenase n=1 Tax=Halococcus morrhuae DSM 1307 TaxID=931277 RepID=M0MC30_HALMO|nr:PQQ-dependent sugar dehydrogenase [Halococcus morrhuae]EMA42893.1 quinoprotein glucose dehydrogenase [Halococcus morrhuae DSM 1307]
MDDTADPTDRPVPRRRFLGLAGAAVPLVAGGRARATPQQQQTPPVPRGPAIGLETVADGFEQPIDFAPEPGGDRRFVLERTGQLYTVDSNAQGNPFIDISDRTTPVEGEQGLLGLAFHLNFQENGKFYLRYSAPPTDATPEPYSHTAVLSEFRATDDLSSGRPGTERRLIEVPEPQSNHNGGAVTFGPDGYLYVSFGDGGAAHDAGTGHVQDWYGALDGGNGQDVTENFLGSMLRIDVDSRTGDKPYGIPDDNPLVGKEGLDEHFAWGLRNPWRMGFSDGDLYVADVGQDRYEEVNVVERGKNYGWNVREGTHCFSPNGDIDSCPTETPGDVRGGERLVGPIIEYPHTRDDEPIGSSVIGGYISKGGVDALDGQYIFGDYSIRAGKPQGSLFVADPSQDGLRSFEKLRIAGANNGELNAHLIAIGRDGAGELYALTAGGDLGGGVHRLVSAANARNEAATTGGANRTNATGTSSTDGPGFGVFAALAGLAAVGARVLGRDG